MIRDHEQGKRDPLLSNAQKLAKALRVSLDVFPAVIAAKYSAVAKKPHNRTRKAR
jgi:hypothetical protein